MRSADVNPPILSDMSLASCCLYIWSPIFWEVMRAGSQQSQNNRHIRPLLFMLALKQWTCVRAIVSPRDSKGRLWKLKRKKNKKTKLSVSYKRAPSFTTIVVLFPSCWLCCQTQSIQLTHKSVCAAWRCVPGSLLLIPKSQWFIFGTVVLCGFFF